MYRRSKRNIINLLFCVKPETDPNSNYEQNLIRFCRKSQFNINKNVTETIEVISFIVFLVICGSNILFFYRCYMAEILPVRCKTLYYQSINQSINKSINQSINILIYIGSRLVYSNRFCCKIKKFLPIHFNFFLKYVDGIILLYKEKVLGCCIH